MRNTLLSRLALAAALAADVGCSSDSPPDTCPGRIGGSTDAHAAERASCAFGAGTHATGSLPLDATEQAAIPIGHVIVLMKENRSFDHIFGNLHAAGQPAVEPIPANFTNPDVANAAIPMTHASTTCFNQDPDHQWFAMHQQVNMGLMDGFVYSAAGSTGGDGHFVMTYYDENDLPFYYWLANTFAVSDRHFASIRSGTFPNRNVLLLGTNAGVAATGGGYPPPGTPTIFDRLDAAGVSWGVYSDGSLLSGTLNWTLAHPGAHPMSDFYASVAAGSLPSVTFVDGIDNVEDEHPTGNVQQGEAWTREVYQAVRNSSIWADSAMIFTYDEAGGFADHVPPPEAVCPADASPAEQNFVENGVRVPFVVISPYARPHSVSHVVKDHSSITRFIETVFDLPALTGRDANASALLDMFDFGCSPSLLDAPPAPEAGTGGCFGSCRLSVDMPTYATGVPIHVTFENCPVGSTQSRVALYTYPATGPTLPHPGALAWKYTNDSHTAPTTQVASGTVTLDASALDQGTWPLPVGGYIVYYLIDGGYVAATSVDLTVH